MNEFRNISELLIQALLKSWESIPRPDPDEICVPDCHFFVDGKEIKEWLKTRSNTNFMADGEFQTYMPFFFFTDMAKVYYSLGYLLKIVQDLLEKGNKLSTDFGTYHFLCFLRENKFENLERLYQNEQKHLIYSVLEIISISGAREFDDAS